MLSPCVYSVSPRPLAGKPACASAPQRRLQDCAPRDWVLCCVPLAPSSVTCHFCVIVASVPL